MILTAKLKYQELISGLKLSIDCPDQSCMQITKDAYRWVKETLDDGQSFIPNFIYDQNRGKNPRKNDPGDAYKCGMCALSFFESVEYSQRSVETIGGPEKVKKLLGYTHLASGQLVEDDGLATVVDGDGHFMLFEFENIALDHKFSIVDVL